MIGIAWFLYSEMRIDPMQLDGRLDGQVVAVKPQTRWRRRRSLFWMTALRLLAAAGASFLAAASASFATAGAIQRSWDCGTVPCSGITRR